jgi:hypothetical protein
MKKIILIFLFSGLKVFAQSLNHPTIDKLEVSYKLPDVSTNDSITMVRSQNVLTLKANVDVSVIYFKILNESNNTIVYQVDYLANSSAITSPEGIVLFRKEANIIYIKSANEIPLNIYLYQITTEDSQGIVSEVYTDIK